MSHSTEKTWDEISAKVGLQARMLKEILQNSAELYQELLELWQFHGVNDQAVADQLFGGTATADQIAMVQDLREATVEFNNLHTAANYSALRRMT